MKRISPMLQSFAKHLRRDQTDAEKKLWMCLRNGQIKEWKFRRQHPIGGYIVDFCCLEGMLIIELDGGQHLEQEDADEKRTTYLNSVGFRVLRFWNDDVLTKTDDVLEEILRMLEGSDNSDPHPTPLPFREREQENSHSRAFSFQEKAPGRERGNQIEERSVKGRAGYITEKF